ncbi:hypothetical protein MACJ_001781 [Theileria orientalis]|uniref:SfiI-subtelomeric related protein family member n=1 Tax=Theileria orientalis TaxID=68886 RepID=A0A976M981_THEOR|nr:hypothetical protein MACJ_001781 [Theileria orientalis]
MESLAILYLLVLGARMAVCGDNGPNSGKCGHNENDAGAKAKFNEYKVKVYSSDGSGNKKIVNENGYEIKPYPYGFYVEFKDEAECVELEVKGSTMWNQGSGNDKVKTLYVDETLSIAIIVLHNRKLIGYGFSDTECSLIGEKDSEDFSESDFEIILNSGSNQNATENDYRKVDYGYGTDYTLNHNVECVEVKHKGTSVWKRGDQDTLYLSYKFDNVWTFVTKSDFAPLEYSKFKFVTVDSNGNNSSDQDDRFTKTGDDDLTLKTTNLKFEEIKYEDNSVWKHSEKSSSKSRPDKILH